MKNIQKKISLTVMVCLAFSMAFAQTIKAVDNKGTIVDIVSSPWLTTGTAIYNKNSGNVVIGNGTAPGTVNPNAALQFTQTDKGILIPKVSLTATNTSAPFSSLSTETANNGLLVYNTTTAGTAPNNVIPGFYYWDAIAWKAVINPSEVTTVGAISTTATTNGATITANTLNLAPANATNGGVVTTVAQTFAGAKSFSNVIKAGTVTYPNAHNSINGQVLTTNASGVAAWAAPSGVTAVGAISGTATANGASISGSTLSLAPADATNGGVVTTGAQTFAGAKTFNSDITVNGLTVGKGLGAVATNSAVGFQALNANSSGNRNAAFGASALSANTTGTFNTAIGSSSLAANVSANGNTAVGTSALAVSTNADNTAVGYAALPATTGDGIYGRRNTGVGALALFSNTSGSVNTALGNGALYANISGNGNTAIGNLADVDAGDLQNATAIGANAKVNQSNMIQLGSTGVLNVRTSGALTTGTITYPNVHGTAGQVLTTSGISGGTASWANPSGVTTFSAGTTGFTPATATSGAVTLGGTLNIANGGTGSTTKNFVDLTTDQTIAGNKTFNSDIKVNSLKIGLGAGSVASNMAIGDNALITNSSGTNNTAIGFEALKATTTGNFNLAIGYQALMTNVSGIKNTAIGFEALKIATGNFNVAIGPQALTSNTTGVNNVAIGAGSGGGDHAALVNNADGFDNVAVGYNTLVKNISGSGNIAIGSAALYNNTSSSNIAIGKDVLESNTTGTDNIAIGAQARRQSASGIGNIVIGNSTNSNGDTANNSVIIGYQAASNLSKVNDATKIGNNNTAIGYRSTFSNNNASTIENATAIGSGAIARASNTIQLGSDGTHPVPGTSAPVPAVTDVKTSGKLTTGAVTYPNTIGVENEILTMGPNGVAYWNTPASGGAGYNLIGPITSIGNTTSVASQTGTGSTFVMDTSPTIATATLNSPTLTTPVLGVATATSINSIKFGLGGGSIASNLAIGESALSANVSGTKNVAIGSNTLQSSTGSFNVAIGQQALSANTEGVRNIAIGAGEGSGVHAALAFNTTGTDNIAVGHNALTKNVSGSNNIAIGSAALQKNTGSANSNIAIGSTASLENLSGNQNIAIGVGARRNSTQGIGNIAIGGSSNSIANLSNNSVFIGYQAASNTSKVNGIVGGTNYLGDNNTAIGHLSTLFNSNASKIENATAIGSGAIARASNTIQLGSDGTPTSPGDLVLAPAVTSVKTSGQLTTGTVTYPNTHNATAGQVLTTNAAGVASWAAPASGVTTFSAGSTGLSPSTATTGAITLTGTLSVTNGGTGASTLNGLVKGNGAGAMTAVTEESVEFTATASQTVFPLSQTPLTGTKVKMYINGLLVKGSLHSLSGTTITYSGSTIAAGAEVVFYFFY